MNKPTVAAALIALLGLPACGTEDGVGTGALLLRISGEGAAKEGYPLVKVDKMIAFADGWNVRFSKFLVSFGAVRLRTSDGVEGFSSDDRYIADLHRGDPTAVTIPGLAARRWDRFGFQIVPPNAAVKNLNEVGADDIALMTAAGLNYYIEGTAEKAGITYTLRWGLRNPTRNSSCTNGIDNTDGFVVKTNGTTVGEITIHVDHMFWDTLGTERANLRFEAIASASPEDHDITFDELASQQLDDLRGRDGDRLKDEKGAALVYNPGSVPLAASNLQAFILASSASQAHINGIGLCTVTSL